MYHAIDFLLYSYFSITLDSSEEKLLYAAIKRAYQDAASHVLSVVDDQKQTLKETGMVYIYRAMLTLAEQKSHWNAEEFDAFHDALCMELCKLYDNEAYYKTKGERMFTYGIAQKWVNMTIKYICLLHDILQETDESSPFADRFHSMVTACKSFFHIPLDSYMLTAVSTELKISPSGYSIQKWSKITEDSEYARYQQAVRAVCNSPLDWENPAWIAQSRKESKWDAGFEAWLEAVKLEN